MTGNTDHDLFWTGSFFKCTCEHYLAAHDIDDAKQEIQEHRSTADRAAGIVRVAVDDETVERVARELMRNAYVVRRETGGLITDYMNTARAVLAALRGES